MNTSNISNPTQFIHSPPFAFYIYAIFSLWQHCRSNYNISYNFAQFLSFLWCDCSWISNHLLHNFLFFFLCFLSILNFLELFWFFFLLFLLKNPCFQYYKKLYEINLTISRFSGTTSQIFCRISNLLLVQNKKKNTARNNISRGWVLIMLLDELI